MKQLFVIILILPLSLAAQNFEKTGIDTGSAIAFINSLNPSQKEKTVFAFSEMSRYDWHYFPATMVSRTGIAIKDLDSVQKIKFYSMLKGFLSDKGYNRSRDIMNCEYILKEMEPGSTHRIPENYFVSIYGNPTDSAWGWKFTGHHIALNFTIVNNQVAFVPFFFGANPATILDGPNKGKRIIKEEEDLGFELVNSLNEQQKSKAIFQLKAFTDIVTTNAVEVSPLKNVGILAKEFTQEQKLLLNKLIAAYLSSMPDTLAKGRMKKIGLQDMNAIRFGWAGGLTTGLPHYYRIQGATFLIEFDNTQNHANHIHSVWREFNGDYGIDLLKEHYHMVKHHK